MSRLKLLAIIALIGGPILAYHTHQEMNERAQIQNDGVTVPGVITDGKVRKKRGSRSYTFDVTYATPDGKTATKNFSVPKKFAENYVQNDAFIRHDVEVRCLPANPDVAFIVGAGDGSPELEYVGYGLGAVGLVGTGLMFRKKTA
jgi:hypothetical protein